MARMAEDRPTILGNFEMARIGLGGFDITDKPKPSRGEPSKSRVGGLG